MPARGARGRNEAAGNALPASAAQGFPRTLRATRTCRIPPQRGAHPSVPHTPAIRYRKEAETRREQGRTQDTSDPPDGQTKPFHGFYLEANGPDREIQLPKASQRQRRQRAKPTLRYPEITVIPQWQCLRWFSSFIVSNPAKSHKRLMAHTTLLSSGAEMETDSGINLMLSPKGVAFRPITVKIVVKQMNIPITPPGLHMTL